MVTLKCVVMEAGTLDHDCRECTKGRSPTLSFTADSVVPDRIPSQKGAYFNRDSISAWNVSEKFSKVAP
ncbi:MAG: hypothetical protein QOK24_2789 [Verrucomicrobiota bacterium]|jgi:hypothetical protein